MLNKKELAEVEKLLWQAWNKLTEIEAKNDVTYKEDKYLRDKVEKYILKAKENLQKMQEGPAGQDKPGK